MAPSRAADSLTPRSADSASHNYGRTRRYLSLFQRVAAVNVLLLLVAVALTVVILVPGRESAYKIDQEGIVLVVAVCLMILVNLLLLRRIMRPLQQLAAVARKVDLADPRPPLPDPRANSEAGELALAFNEMLARLRAERRQATGRVLAGQEAERLRIAQELHDQVGQELTAVLLVLSRLQAHAPDDLRPAVIDAQDSVRASLENVRRIAIELRESRFAAIGCRPRAARPACAHTARLRAAALPSGWDQCPPRGRGGSSSSRPGVSRCPSTSLPISRRWRRMSNWFCTEWRKKRLPTSPATPRAAGLSSYWNTIGTTHAAIGAIYA